MLVGMLKNIYPALVSLVLMALFLVIAVQCAQIAHVAPSGSILLAIPSIFAIVSVVGFVLSGLKLVIWLFDECRPL